MFYFPTRVLTASVGLLAAISAGLTPATAAPTQGTTTPEWQRGCITKPTSERVVNVRNKGALGDGSHDDSAAFARAVAAVEGTGGTLLVPAGDYRIDPAHPVSLGSDMTLRMAEGAQLRALASDQQAYYIVLVRDAARVNIVGGTVIGDRAIHQGTAGEWGHGVGILSSRKVRVQDVVAREAWGDGFYVGGAGTRRITLCRVEAAENRRQGLSITYAEHITVRGSIFRNTHGHVPELGIDVEPNAGEHVDDVLLWHNLIKDNAGGGISLGMPLQFIDTAYTIHGVALRNKIMRNGYGALGALPRVGINLSSGTGNKALHNIVRDNIGIGIASYYTTDNVIRGNSITGTQVSSTWPEGGAGIHMEETHGLVCTRNVVHDNLGPYQVYSWNSDTPRRNCTSE